MGVLEPEVASEVPELMCGRTCSDTTQLEPVLWKVHAAQACVRAAGERPRFATEMAARCPPAPAPGDRGGRGDTAITGRRGRGRGRALPACMHAAQHSSGVLACLGVPLVLSPTPCRMYGVPQLPLGASAMAACAAAGWYTLLPGYLMLLVHSFCVIGAPCHPPRSWSER